MLNHKVSFPTGGAGPQSVADCQNSVVCRGHHILSHADSGKPGDDCTGAGAYTEEPTGTRAGSNCSFHTIAS